MLNETYLFIDGGYFNGVYSDVFAPIFGGEYLVDYAGVMATFGATRAFLYDCVDDIPNAGENDADYRARVQRQKDRLDEIDKVEGLHVRLGHLRRGKRGREQKEVDVQLAVEMLTNSFYKNMGQAVLIAGDRDFKPLVESVVRLGTKVKVAYDPHTIAKELAKAADYEMQIDITALCRWIKLDKYDDRGKHFPSVYLEQNVTMEPLDRISPAPTSRRKGTIGQAKHALSLGEVNKVWYASVQNNARD